MVTSTPKGKMVGVTDLRTEKIYCVLNQAHCTYLIHIDEQMNTHKANMWLYSGTDEGMCFDEIPDLDGEYRPKFKVNSLSCSLQCNFAYALIVYHLSWAITPHKEPPKNHVSSSSLYMIF